MSDSEASEVTGDNLSSLTLNPYLVFARRQFDRSLAIEQVQGDLPWFVDLVCGLIKGIDEEMELIRSGQFKWSVGSLTGLRGACLNLGFNTLAWIWHTALTANEDLHSCLENDAVWCIADFSHAYLDHFHAPLAPLPLTVTELALIRDELPKYAAPELEYAREVLFEFMTTIERSFIKLLVQGVHTASDDQPLGRLRRHELYDPNVLLEIDELLTGKRKHAFLTQECQSNRGDSQ